MTEPRTVAEVFQRFVAHPWEMLGRRWNYKTAVLSSLVRASIFFGTNASAGFEAAVGAAAAEMALRLLTSGFYGAITQSFRYVEPRAAAMLTAMVLLPTLAHSLELLVHWARGTPALATSMAVSVAFTVLSTAFNLFVMRQGALVVGAGRRSMLHDLAAMPRLVVMFVKDAARSVVRVRL